jgi:hypothetical protein
VGSDVSRRSFLLTTVRAVAAGGLALLAGRLLGVGTRSAREVCTNDSICRGCGAAAGCGLPAALSFRERTGEG